MLLDTQTIIGYYTLYTNSLRDGSLTDYTVEIEGDLNKVDPLLALKVLNKQSDIDAKAELVDALCYQRNIAICYKGEVIKEFRSNTNDGSMRVVWFSDNPFAYKILVDFIFGLFLKKCVPCSQNSTEDKVNKKME